MHRIVQSFSLIREFLIPIVNRPRQVGGRIPSARQLPQPADLVLLQDLRNLLVVPHERLLQLIRRNAGIIESDREVILALAFQFRDLVVEQVVFLL